MNEYAEHTQRLVFGKLEQGQGSVDIKHGYDESGTSIGGNDRGSGICIAIYACIIAPARVYLLYSHVLHQYGIAASWSHQTHTWCVRGTTMARKAHCVRLGQTDPLKIESHSKL